MVVLTVWPMNLSCCLRLFCQFKMATSAIEGLPIEGFRDIRMETARGVGDIHMATAKGYPTLADDIRMETARAAATLKNNNLKVWERELIQSPEVKRKATVAQLCNTSKSFWAISHDFQTSLIITSRILAISQHVKNVVQSLTGTRVQDNSALQNTQKNSSPTVAAKESSCAGVAQSSGLSSFTSLHRSAKVAMAKSF